MYICPLSSQDPRAYIFSSTITQNYILLSIEDNGVGIKEVNKIKILEPYFTTKKNGTGLGLSIVNKIINDHGGEIKFYPINDGAKIEIGFNKKWQ